MQCTAPHAHAVHVVQYIEAVGEGLPDGLAATTPGDSSEACLPLQEDLRYPLISAGRRDCTVVCPDSILSLDLDGLVLTINAAKKILATRQRLQGFTNTIGLVARMATLSSLDEALRGVAAEKKDQQCSRDDLNEISKSLTR